MKDPTYLPGDMASIRELIVATCAVTDALALADKITCQWKRDFTARLGDANPSTNRIRLSIPLMNRADLAQRRTTIIHEACHLISAHKHGATGRGHGREWQLLMLECGERPDRCHNVDNSDLKRRMPRVQASCGCGPKPITPQRAKKMLRGAAYRCLTCSKLLTLPTTPTVSYPVAAYMRNRAED